MDRVYTTDEIKKIIEPIARTYGIGRLSLFGSYARGEARPGSDIDIRLVDGGNIHGWFKLARFNRELEEHLGIKVDLIDCDSSDHAFLNKIVKDEVIIYEQ